MSDAPQGPDWWQGPDGKWYAPSPYLTSGAQVQQHLFGQAAAPPAGPTPGPAAPPPGPPPGRPPGQPPGQAPQQHLLGGAPSLATPSVQPAGFAEAYPQRPLTSGLAIASLVLSILWIFGLGSLVAVILGFAGLHHIRSSKGRRTGSGLAVAGIVIGFLGILGGVGTGVALDVIGHKVVHAYDNAKTPVTLTVGRTGDYGTGGLQLTDVRSVTVQSVTVPFTPVGTGNPLPAGYTDAVAGIQECAGSSGLDTGPSPQDWQLLTAGGTVLQPSTGAENPDVSSIGQIAPGSCVQFFVTFTVPPRTRPAFIEFHAPGPFDHPYRWRINSG